MPPRGGDDDPFGPLRPNAPVSVVRAAKASLKEPTRPHTPGDLSRGLFTSTGDSGARPNSSYGIPTSKNFFEGSSKLGLGKLDLAPVRQDSLGGLGGKSRLSGGDDRSPAQTSSYGAATRSISEHSNDGSPMAPIRSNSRGRSSSHSRKQTPAETVAALKAGMAANGSFYFEDETPGTEEERYDIGGSSSDDEGTQRMQLDPHRNDDLPLRPGTSRGRAAGSEPAFSSGGLEGPPKPNVLGGAQVLDVGPASGSDDDDVNDDAYRHMYNYAPAVEEPPAPCKKPDRPGLPLPLSTPSAAQQVAAAAKSYAAIDPNDPFVAWRTAVEKTLHDLAASASQCAAAKEVNQTLLDHCTMLGTHVDYLRKQPESSKWLRSPSASFLDTKGHAVSMREAISENVFRLMDFSHTELLLKSCGIVLRVVKSRQPLLQASKLLYRLSKDTSNDTAFRRELLLEPIVRTVHVMVASTSNSSGPMHEPLVFLNGCLKNVSNDASNQKALVKLGALGVLSTLLTHMASQIDSPSRVGTPAGAPPPAAQNSSEGGFTTESAGQVTGVFRNLAVSPSHTSTFISSGAMAALRATARALSTHAEVVLNIGRILSKLSLQPECQAAMEADREPRWRQTESRDGGRQRVRSLAGQTAGQISMVPGSLATIISILHLYALGADARPDTPVSATNSSRVDRLARAATRQDCLIKILRLAANLAINEEVLNLEPQEILRHVTPLLMCGNDEAMIEAARTYGNFSRIPGGREYMQQVCGTLINFTADPGLKSHLVSILTVILKALYNISADDITSSPIGTSTRAPEDDDDAHTACSLTEDEINMLGAILDHVRDSSPMLMVACPNGEGDEVLQLCDQLDTQLDRLEKILESDNLEAI
eukprot:gene16626-22873_t